MQPLQYYLATARAYVLLARITKQKHYINAARLCLVAYSRALRDFNNLELSATVLYLDAA